MNWVLGKYNVKPADRLVAPKSGLRVVQHHVIYLGENKFGQSLIIENKIGFGVRVITADEFFKDVIEITEIKRFSGNNYERKLAVQNALQKIGRPYDLINYNCQHFANEIQHGVAKSEQVDGFFDGIKVIGGAALFIGFIAAIFND